MGLTQRCQRTFLAFGRAVWDADDGSQLDQGLAEISGPVRRNHSLYFLLKAPFHRLLQDIVIAFLNPGKHPQHIAVHSRIGQAEGNGRDGPRRIASDARQLQNRVKIRGHLTVVFCHQLPGGFLHISDTVIIS